MERSINADNSTDPTEPTLFVRDVAIWQGFLGIEAQKTLIAAIREVVAQAPLFHPETMRGRKMSVRMTSAGRCGWVSDRKGYRYEPCHPSGVPWPAIPKEALMIWHAVSGVTRAPDSCLINYYSPEAKMGLHQDRDEGDFSWPVVSVSLGDDALFRIGSETRGGKTESLWLKSGDVAVLAGASRLVYHGVDRIRPGTSSLLSQPGRINLTLRAVASL